MASLCSGLSVLLFFSGISFPPSSAFPPKHAPPPAPQLPEDPRSSHGAQERQPVNTVSVTCHPDSLEVVVKADMFGVGAPVDSDHLHLGVAPHDLCRATASSREEFRILVGLLDCGTKYWMTEDSLVYTNLLIYSPPTSLDGVVRMDEAVIPIECHYERRYGLSSSSLTPTWIPFMSTQAAVETLEFSLRIMTPDWLYERSSNVFYLGDPINLEASVRVGHHMGLRAFVSSCVATLQPDASSVPRYGFIEHGCLMDSQLPGSKSHFLPRNQDNKLHLVIDAFRFHNEDRGELYITCHLSAVPVDTEAPNKACTFVNGRWRSADGNDYLCGYCQSQSGQTSGQHSSTGKFSPRGFGKPDYAQPQWRSGLTPDAWEHEAQLGPMVVLPARQTLPAEELPPVLNNILSKPLLYGSQWKSGINYHKDLEKGLLPGLVTSDSVNPISWSEEEEDDSSSRDLKDAKDAESPTAAPEHDATGTEPQTPPADPVIPSNSTSAATDPKR